MFPLKAESIFSIFPCALCPEPCAGKKTSHNHITILNASAAGWLPVSIEKHRLSADMADLGTIFFNIIQLPHVHPLLA